MAPAGGQSSASVKSFRPVSRTVACAPLDFGHPEISDAEEHETIVAGRDVVLEWSSSTGNAADGRAGRAANERGAPR